LKKPEQIGTRKRPPDQVKSGGITSSKHQKIEKHETKAVSKLYIEAETRRRALQPTEKHLMSVKDAEEIVEESIGSELVNRNPYKPTRKKKKDVESGILDDTTWDQCGASIIRHADLVDDLTWQLHIGLPPCADAVQTMLKYEEDLISRQSRIHTSRPKSVTDLF
jgi:hypothetical protein